MSRSPLFGTWRNSDVTSQSVVALAFEGDRVQAWTAALAQSSAHDAPNPSLGIGRIERFGGIADAAPLAFTARLPGTSGESILLQGNINRGLMILATYVWTSGDPVLAGRFTREFLARRHAGVVVPVSSTRVEDAGQPSVVKRVGFEGDRRPAPLASREFLGHWRNASNEGDLRSLDIAVAGSQLSLRVRGSGERLPALWPSGESHLFGYQDELGHDTLLLLGRFELPEGRSDLQIKVVTGTAVIASFHSRSAGKSWFTREFLHRV